MLPKFLLGGGIIAAIIALLIFSGKLPVGDTASKPQGEVVLWGTFPETEMDNIIQSFNPQAKSYRILYKEIKADSFVQTLVEALANGTGPDMILAPHQIILSQSKRLYPFPVASLSEKKFKDTYIDGASIFFSPYGAIALPVSIEPMVMFYNRTLFAKAGITNPPTYWEEVYKITPSLTSVDGSGTFLESAIALGSPNVSYAKDILMAIVLQLGQSPVILGYNGEGAVLPNIYANTPLVEGGDVLPLSTATRFFTQFSDATKSTYTWSPSSGRPDDKFVAEKLAMYIGYSGELTSLRARNPRADFEMTYLPQTKGQDTFATGAQLYGIATLKSSKNPVASLTVQSEFGGTGIAPALSSIVSGNPPFRAFVNTQGLNEVIARSMLVARPWYDSFPNQSMNLISDMLSDILNNRMELNDAVAIFVNRLQDIYTPR